MKKVMMFSASWCMPCQRTKPVFVSVRQELTDIQMEIIDVDEAKNLSEQYDIRAVPTFVLLKDDKEVARTSGGMTADKLKEFINQ
jgi:thioredoxin 1